MTPAELANYLDSLIRHETKLGTTTYNDSLITPAVCIGVDVRYYRDPDGVKEYLAEWGKAEPPGLLPCAFLTTVVVKTPEIFQKYVVVCSKLNIAEHGIHTFDGCHLTYV